MADVPRGRVTITLGRTGQVVRKPTDLSDAFIDSPPSAGSKRSIRDRLGDNGDGSLVYGHQMSSKRQRGDMFMPSQSSNGLDDACFDRDDLRYMLMQKNVRRRAESDEERKVADLRQKLVKKVNPPASSLRTRHRTPERKENGYLAAHSRVPPTGNANYLPRTDPLRSSHPPFPSDHLRQRSPERYVSHSRAHSPWSDMGEIRRRPVMRTSEDFRSAPHVRRETLHPSRPMHSTPYVMDSKHPSITVRPPHPSGQNPPPSGSSWRSSLVIDEHQTVDGLLNALELGKYAIIFKAEEVDMSALKQMGEHDLKELGIPMGPRKKILQAINPRLKRQR